MPSNYRHFGNIDRAIGLGIALGLFVLLSPNAIAYPQSDTNAPYVVAQAQEGDQTGQGAPQEGGGGDGRLRRRFQDGQGGQNQGQMQGDPEGIRRRMRQRLRQRFSDGGGGGGEPGMQPGAPGDGQQQPGPAPGPGQQGVGDQGPGSFRPPGDDMPRFRENRRQGGGQGGSRRGGQGEFGRRGDGQGGMNGGGGMRGNRKFGGGGGGGRFFGRAPLDLSALNLTETQKTRIKELRQQSTPRARELQKSVHQARMGLKDMMFDPNMTDAQIRAKRAELRKLQDQSEELTLNDFLTIRGVLTKEQKARLPQIKPGEGGPGGPGGAGGPGGGGGPPGGPGDGPELSDGPPRGGPGRLQGFRPQNQD